MLIEKARRLAHGYRNFGQLPPGHAPGRERHPHPMRQDHGVMTTLKSEEPTKSPRRFGLK
jgi:hypothetical protein